MSIIIQSLSSSENYYLFTLIFFLHLESTLKAPPRLTMARLILALCFLTTIVVAGAQPYETVQAKAFNEHDHQQSHDTTHHHTTPAATTSGHEAVKGHADHMTSAPTDHAGTQHTTPASHAGHTEKVHRRK